MKRKLAFGGVMKIRGTVLLFTFTLCACGTLAQNSEVPNAPYLGIGDRRQPGQNVAVKIVDTGPEAIDDRQHVEGYSCKNKLWDPAPSRENAVAFMKTQAAEWGYNSIHSVVVSTDEASMAKNCWAGIVATGVAFNDQPPASAEKLRPKH